MTVAVAWVTERVASRTSSLALADEFWSPADETEEVWRSEVEEYLESIKPIVSRGFSRGITPSFSDDAYVAHVTNKLKRSRRWSMAEHAEARRLRTAERLMSDVEHFGDRSDDWCERSRTLILRGRSIRSVLARTWADDESRHYMVCWGRTEDGMHRCKLLTPLALGGPWRYWRRYDECPEKWYRKPTYRSALRHAALDEYRRDDLQDANEAFGLQLLHPVALLIFAQLVAAIYSPHCDECGVLVGRDDEGRHRYGHERSHNGYEVWTAAQNGCYTSQSLNWLQVQPALYWPVRHWLAPRTWSTHVRRFTIGAVTIWWQPRPIMSEKRSSFKRPFPVKPGNGNYSVV